MARNIKGNQVAFTLALIALSTGPLWAAGGGVTFVPPNDPSGLIYDNKPTNDGYSDGRGIVFTPNAGYTLSSVGTFQDLTDITISYQVAQVSDLTGDIETGETILRSGSQTVTTDGFQFVDFSFADLALTTGSDYAVTFSFSGQSNRNFFFNNANVPFSRGDFASIDGIQNGNAANSVLPGIELNGGDGTVITPSPPPSIPESSQSASLGLLLALGGGAVVFRRRRA